MVGYRPRTDSPNIKKTRLLLGNPHLNADIVVKFDSCDCKEKPMNNTKISLYWHQYPREEGVQAPAALCYEHKVSKIKYIFQEIH